MLSGETIFLFRCALIEIVRVPTHAPHRSRADTIGGYIDSIERSTDDNDPQAVR